LTLDELLADLDREVLRTWGEGSGSASADGPSRLAVQEAHGSAPEAAESAGERCLLVTLPGRRFAVPTRAVVAVSELPPVSAVPFSPPWLRGVTRAAGGVVAVVDLARLLAASDPWSGAPGAPPNAAPLPPALPRLETAAGDTAREILLVVRTADADLDAGLAVPGVARLVSLAAAPHHPGAAGEIAARRSAFVARLAPDPAGSDLPPVAVLDVDRLLRRAREGLGA
jgi:chemotaxis signal transduction protein